MNKKRIIIITIIIASVCAVVYFLFVKQSNQEVGIDSRPTKTVVPLGETVTPSKNSNSSQGSNNGSTSQNSNNAQNTTTPPTTQQFYTTIAQSGGIAPDADGQIRFGVTGVKQPLPGWFIVTIQKGSSEPNKVILQQTGNSSSPLHIVAGPGTSFPTTSVNIPDAVRKAL